MSDVAHKVMIAEAILEAKQITENLLLGIQPDKERLAVVDAKLKRALALADRAEG